MIQFSQLWGLAALLSIPLIVLLFALRPKRKTLVVSSNRLWQEAIKERQKGQGLQKLLRDLSLILFLVLALLLSLGLAGLGWTLPSSGNNDIVVILDVSASMQARSTDGLSRFEDARNQVAKVINRLDRNSRLLLMTSGHAAIIRTAFESDRSTLGRTLEEIKVTDEAGDPRQAMVLALSLLRKDNDGKIFFFTDRAFDAPEGLDTSRIEYRSAEGSSRNLAITRFDFRAEVGSEERHQVLVTVRNYTQEALVPELRVEVNRKSLFVQPLALDPGQQRTLVVPLQGRLSGIARAVLAIDDDLAADNEVFAVIAASETRQILLLSPGNIYLDSVLAALPNVSVDRLQSLPTDLAQRVERYDVVIIDSIESPLELPAGNYLLVNTVPPELSMLEQGQVANPLIAGSGGSALMQDIDLDGLRIGRSRKVALDAEPPAVQKLFWSAETALALAIVKDDKRITWLGFDLADSNFPLHASFPLFFGKSLQWLQSRAEQVRRTPFVAGESISLLAPNEVTKAEVLTPAGNSLGYNVVQGKLEFRETSESGIYRYQTDQFDYPFAVNLSNENESDIRPRAVQAVNAVPVPRASTGHTDIPLWPWLVMLALLLLMLEWCLWCWRGVSA